MRLAESARARALVVDASGLAYCDAGAAALFGELERRQRDYGGTFAIEGLRSELATIVDLVRPGEEEFVGTGKEPEHPVPYLERLGRTTTEMMDDVRKNVVFVGHVTVALFQALRRPASLRMKDVFRVAEAVGIGAVPIVALVGFLLGLILSFQSAVSMQRFGAEIYVADLLVISMLRELGPLMAAILLAARSGSAFAAEIGTMKVNEEVDALTTMGLEPVRFLIVPRVIAALAMTPIVALLTNFFGLLGGAVVMRSIGFPWVTFMNRIADAGTVTDLTSGLVKAFVFGVIVASVGCLRGLGTGKGAGAVGESTTSSVVTCIVLIGITDGIFAVIFYVIGI
jgi:phospholipid/cholesterol/gamma-HCH transport system permease protein